MFINIQRGRYLTVLLGLLTCSPVVSCLHIAQKFEEGRYPVNADSIGLGFFFVTIAFVVISPVFYALIIWSGRNFQNRVNLFAYDRNRFTHSFIWTFLSLFFALLLIKSVFYSIEEKHYWEAAYYVLCPAAAGIFRAVMVGKKLSNNEAIQLETNSFRTKKSI